MKTELLLVIMAGTVLSLFLIVSEIAAMRKRVKNVRTRLLEHWRHGRYLRLLVEVCAIAVFFLIQPVIVAALVALALDDLNPGFSGMVLQQVRQAF
jgi:hypothetical protein